MTRRVEKIYPSKGALGKVLRSSKKLKLYLGVDPTGGNLHLGHAIPLMKLQEFIEFGHQVIFLVGNFTALCGDPSGHEGARKSLTPTQIAKNMATYKKQASKVLDFSKTEMKYNAEWLSKLTFKKIIKLASNFTVQQMIERDLFQRRLKAKRPIYLHEFLYPLLQGYDSVAMNVDLEVGGTDQTFNMLAGRALQKIYNKKEKFVLTTKMVVGLDGERMSKTRGNTVNLLDGPDEMYGKIMSLRDELIVPYFELCTTVPMTKIKELSGVAKREPMGVKKQLAYEITKMYHSEREAAAAQREFEEVFQKGGIPKSPPTLEIKVGERIKIGEKTTVGDLLVRCKLTGSRSEAHRLINQGGVKVDGKKVKDYRAQVKIRDGMIVKVGKRRFTKIKG